jgi:hypothetical protein
VDDGSSSNENGRALIRAESKLRGQARSKENAEIAGFVNFIYTKRSDVILLEMKKRRRGR